MPKKSKDKYSKKDEEEYNSLRDDTRHPSCIIIPEEKLNEVRVIGEGFYAKVKVGEWTRPNNKKELVAIKCIKETGSEHHANDALLREATNMVQLQHKHVIKLFGISLSKQHSQVKLVTEYSYYGSLVSVLNDTRPEYRRYFLQVTRLWLYALQIAEGMQYLVEQNIVHFDLAARNILVMEPDLVRISDFGLARVLNESQVNITPKRHMAIKWCAPEILKSKPYTYKCDVWSYGVLLWELMSFGEKPWEDYSTLQIIEQADQPNVKLPKPKACSDRLYRIMNECWEYLPDNRPDFTELLLAINTLKPQVGSAKVSLCTQVQNELSFRIKSRITIIERLTDNQCLGQNENAEIGQLSTSNINMTIQVLERPFSKAENPEISGPFNVQHTTAVQLLKQWKVKETEIPGNLTKLNVPMNTATTSNNNTTNNNNMNTANTSNNNNTSTATNNNTTNTNNMSTANATNNTEDPHEHEQEQENPRNYEPMDQDDEEDFLYMNHQNYTGDFLSMNHQNYGGDFLSMNLSDDEENFLSMQNLTSKDFESLMADPNKDIFTSTFPDPRHPVSPSIPEKIDPQTKNPDPPENTKTPVKRPPVPTPRRSRLLSKTEAPQIIDVPGVSKDTASNVTTKRESGISSSLPAFDNKYLSQNAPVGHVLSSADISGSVKNLRTIHDQTDGRKDQVEWDRDVKNKNEGQEEDQVFMEEVQFESTKDLNFDEDSPPRLPQKDILSRNPSDSKNTLPRPLIPVPNSYGGIRTQSYEERSQFYLPKLPVTQNNENPYSFHKPYPQQLPLPPTIDPAVLNQPPPSRAQQQIKSPPNADAELVATAATEGPSGRSDRNEINRGIDRIHSEFGMPKDKCYAKILEYEGEIDQIIKVLRVQQATGETEENACYHLKHCNWNVERTANYILNKQD